MTMKSKFRSDSRLPGSPGICYLVCYHMKFGVSYRYLKTQLTYLEIPVRVLDLHLDGSAWWAVFLFTEELRYTSYEFGRH